MWFKYLQNMKMKTEVIFLSLTVLTGCICKWKPYKPPNNWRDYAYDKGIKLPAYDRTTTPGPELRNEMIPLARYMLHNAEWASVATISALPEIKGYPFSNIKPMVDGPVDRSSGIPYFYFSPMDLTSKNLKLNKNATVLVTYEETIFCENEEAQAQPPLCTRLMLSGKIKKVKRGSSEMAFARAALFARHPSLAEWPAEYNWFVAKLKIAHIALINWIGDTEYMSVDDYLEYNYTGREIKEIEDETE